MPVRKRDNGSITGSKRYKAEKQTESENSIGAKVKAVAEAAGTKLNDTSKTVSNVASTVGNTASTVGKVVNDVSQGLRSLTGQGGYQNERASGKLQHSTDVYGGLAIPEVDFKTFVSSDILNPSGLPECSQEQLTQGLATYASATRAQELYQAGFKYIEEVGKTKQQYHKAQSSVIRAATEGVKVQQNIVDFDIANVDLAAKGQKLEQSNEKLKQEQIKTTAAQNETLQLAQKIEALESKRDAEISRIRSQTQDIIQRYLKDSIQGVA